MNRFTMHILFSIRLMECHAGFMSTLPHDGFETICDNCGAINAETPSEIQTFVSFVTVLVAYLAHQTIITLTMTSMAAALAASLPAPVVRAPTPLQAPKATAVPQRLEGVVDAEAARDVESVKLNSLVRGLCV